jgi:hypothetical protein
MLLETSSNTPDASLQQSPPEQMFGSPQAFSDILEGVIMETLNGDSGVIDLTSTRETSALPPTPDESNINPPTNEEPAHEPWGDICTQEEFERYVVDTPSDASPETPIDGIPSAQSGKN